MALAGASSSCSGSTLSVHLGVVDDLIGDVDGAIGEVGPSLVSHCNLGGMKWKIAV
jgi:hypothetical protein